MGPSWPERPGKVPLRGGGRAQPILQDQLRKWGQRWWGVPSSNGWVFLSDGRRWAAPGTLALGVWGRGDAEVAWGSVSCPLQSLPSKDTLNHFHPGYDNRKVFPIVEDFSAFCKVWTKSSCRKVYSFLDIRNIQSW